MPRIKVFALAMNLKPAFTLPLGPSCRNVVLLPRAIILFVDAFILCLSFNLARTRSGQGRAEPNSGCMTWRVAIQCTVLSRVRWRILELGYTAEYGTHEPLDLFP